MGFGRLLGGEISRCAWYVVIIPHHTAISGYSEE